MDLPHPPTMPSFRDRYSTLADWIARAADGQERMSGTNLFTLGPDAKFTCVSGFANQP